MKPINQNVDDELVHQQQIHRILRERQRVLELRIAREGTDAPPHVMIEISSIDGEILECEKKITRLEAFKAEAEYCALLIKVLAHLELARLRLGIPLERAQNIEYEIRIPLPKTALGASL